MTIKRDPDKAGSAAAAWRIRLDDAPPPQNATLAAWVVRGDFHPIWNAWEIAVIHLRAVLGMPPADRRYPEATHEFIIASLNPDYPADPDDRQSLHALLPLDLSYQCHGLSDEQAVAVCDSMVGLIVDGTLSPDQDYRRAWRAYLVNQVLTLTGGSV